MAARPVRTKTPSCVAVRWSKDNQSFTIDLTRFLILQPLVMQTGTTAHIPVSEGPVPGWGQSLIFHFSQTTIQPIVPGKKRSKETAGETEKTTDMKNKNNTK